MLDLFFSIQSLIASNNAFSMTPFFKPNFEETTLRNSSSVSSGIFTKMFPIKRLLTFGYKKHSNINIKIDNYYTMDMIQNKIGKITAKQIEKLQVLGGEAEEKYKIAQEELSKAHSAIVKSSNLIEKIRKDNDFSELQ